MNSNISRIVLTILWVLYCLSFGWVMVEVRDQKLDKEPTTVDLQKDRFYNSCFSRKENQ